MSTKLYVGNLSYDAAEEDVKELFSSFGSLEDVYVAKDKFTGKARGFAFVTYSDEQSAEKAQNELNGTDLMGRALKVDIAQPRQERPRDGGGRNFRQGGGGGGHRGGHRSGGGGRDRRERRH